MKKVIVLSIILTIGLIVSNHSFAAGTSTETGKDNSSMQSGFPEKGTQKQDDQASRMRQSSTMIGMDVKNLEGETLGSVYDIVLDTFNDRIAYVLMKGERGLVAGTERVYAVPWKFMKPSVSGDVLILDIDKERFSRAPFFTEDNRPNFADREWGVNLYNYYGVTPYWNQR